jgi:hypothetical protein
LSTFACFLLPCHPSPKAEDLLFLLRCIGTSTKADFAPKARLKHFITHVISTGAAQFHRAAQWRDPCISSLLLLLTPFKLQLNRL